MLLSRLFNGLLSLMTLSRPPSFASANAPEANLGFREEVGNMQANLQRRILRTKPRHCSWVTAKNEEVAPHKQEANRVAVQLQHQRGN